MGWVSGPREIDCGFTVLERLHPELPPHRSFKHKCYMITYKNNMHALIHACVCVCVHACVLFVVQQPLTTQTRVAQFGDA